MTTNRLKSRPGVAIIGTHARGGIHAVINNHIDAGVYQGYQTYTIASHIEGGAITRIIQFIKALVQLIGLLISHKLSICHMHGSMKGSLWRKAILISCCRLFNCTVIFHLHGSQFAEVYEKSGKIYRKLVAYVFNHSQQVFVLSNYWLDYVRPLMNHNNICIINNFPSPVFETIGVGRQQQDTAHKNLLFLGYVGERKGIYDLITAVNLLAEKGFDNFTLHVGGNGELDKLEQLITAKNLQRFVNVVGWVGEAQKQQLMQQADMFILPSYNEGLPIAILEAMAAGVPVISTPVGGIPDAITHEKTGLLVTPGDSQAIADSIEQYCVNLVLRQKIADSALKLYQTDYSAQANTSRIQDTLQALPGSAQQPSLQDKQVISNHKKGAIDETH